jgi:hypothetical protein
MKNHYENHVNSRNNLTNEMTEACNSDVFDIRLNTAEERTCWKIDL